MPEPLTPALSRLRPLLLDSAQLVRAVASGRRRATHPVHERVELRPVDLMTGRCVQLVTRDGPLVRTHNLDEPAAAEQVDALLSEPFGCWHVQTRSQTVQLRVTKRGEAQVHRTTPAPPGPATASAAAPDTAPEPVPVPVQVDERAHDRRKRHLVEPDDPLFAALQAGADKRRQVDAFLRMLSPVVSRVEARATLGRRPLHVLDLGCGNAYLTFATHRWLSGRATVRYGVRTVGVDVRADLVARSNERADRARLPGLDFVVGRIGDGGPPMQPVDIVLALHACDTATDAALAAAVRWQAPLVLAAPCCHHDVQRQLAAGAPDHRRGPAALLRHAILRERLGDVLTDAARAALLRLAGYRVDVMEFVASRHTPRNVLLRAVRTGARPEPRHVEEYRDLVDGWGIRPALATMLPEQVAALQVGALPVDVG